jgi:hypothetical protein
MTAITRSTKREALVVASGREQYLNDQERKVL